MVLQTLLLLSGAERSPGHELPGVAAEETLAERSLPAHQVHDGSRPEALLEKIAFIMHSLLIAWNTEIINSNYLHCYILPNLRKCRRLAVLYFINRIYIVGNSLYCILSTGFTLFPDIGRIVSSLD